MDTYSIIRQEKKCRNLFNLLPKQEIEKIEIQHLTKGEALLKTNEYPSYIYVILDGICTLYKETVVSTQPQVVTRMGYMDVVGMYEIIRNIRRLGSVYAYTDCTVAAIPRAVGEEWIEQHPRFMMELCIKINDRQYGDSDYINYYTKFSVDCAVISFLIHEWNLNTRKNTQVKRLKVDCTRKYIGEIVGRDLRSVNRTIEWLKRNELIQLEKGKIYLTQEKIDQLEIIRIKEMDGRSLR